MKSSFEFLNHRQTMFSVTSQEQQYMSYIIANFQFERLESYWQRPSQSLQIFMDRLFRLTASLQNQKHKIQNNIFENIFFEAVDH